MSVIVNGASNGFGVSSAAGAALPYLDHAWVLQASALQVGCPIYSSETDSSENHSNSLLLQATGAVNARTRDTVNASAASSTSISIDTWSPVAAAFVTASLREAYVNGGSRGEQTSSRTLNAAGYTRVGSWGGSFAGANNRYAEITRWDVTGFTQANREALVSRLGTLVGGKVPDPRNVNEDVGEPWTGKLVRYWRFFDTADRNDVLGSGDNFSVIGSVSTSTAHPDVEEYAPIAVLPTISDIAPDPIVEGSSFVITGTDFKPGATAPTVAWGGAAQTVTASSDTEITCTAVLGSNVYGQDRAVVVTNSDAEINNDPYNVAMSPATGEDYTDLTEALASTGQRITAIPDLVTGAQLNYRNLEDSTSTPSTLSNLIVYPDGSLSLAGSVSLPASFDVRANNNDGDGWGAWAEQRLIGPVVGAGSALFDLTVSMAGTGTSYLQHVSGDGTFTADLSVAMSGAGFSVGLTAVNSSGASFAVSLTADMAGIGTTFRQFANGTGSFTRSLANSMAGVGAVEETQKVTGTASFAELLAVTMTGTGRGPPNQDIGIAQSATIEFHQSRVDISFHDR